MPKCHLHECGKELPQLRMIIVKECNTDQGAFWYFCSWLHLFRWLEERFMDKRGQKPGMLDSKAYLGQTPRKKV